VGCEHAGRVALAPVKVLLRYWLPLLIWMALIFIGSTELMSGEHTSRFLVPFLRWVHPTISPLALMKIEYAIRKVAHVTEYTVLAALMLRAFVHVVFSKRWAVAALVAFSVCGAFAASDEFHQSFVPSRTASARDVMIDCAGVLIGLLLYAIIARPCYSRKLANRQAKAGPERI
jgi:VanZ family protein